MASSQRQVIVMPPSHISTLMVQRGIIIMFGIPGILPVWGITFMPGIMPVPMFVVPIIPRSIVIIVSIISSPLVSLRVRPQQNKYITRLTQNQEILDNFPIIMQNSYQQFT